MKVYNAIGAEQDCVPILLAEKLNKVDFSSNCILRPEEGPVPDLYSLGPRDYILGPESTFSRWASFCGGKPLIVMRKDWSKANLEKAEIVRW